MKRFLFILAFCSTVIMNAQEWEQIGDDVQGLRDFDFAGTSVTVNDAGNIIAVFDALDDLSPLGRVRFFNLQGSSFAQFGNEIPGLAADNISSATIKLNAAGNRLIFSSRLHYVGGLMDIGGVRVFELQGSNWVQIGDTLLGSIEGDLFGNAIDISNSGDRIVIGATQRNTSTSQSGYAEVYQWDSGSWTMLGSRIEGISDGDEAGTSVAINGAGDIIAVGAPLNDIGGTDSGQVRSFQFEANNWVQLGTDIYGQSPGDRMGGTIEQGATPLSFNGDGNILAIGSRLHDVMGFQEGQVRVFNFDGTNWAQYGQDINGGVNNRSFGVTLGLNSIGDRLIVGDLNGNDTGSVRAFIFESGGWSEFGSTITGEQENEFFGSSVDINGAGDLIIVGAAVSGLYGQSRGYARILGNDFVLGHNTPPNPAVAQIYPNPNNGTFQVSFAEQHDGIQVDIFDILGRKVAHLDYFGVKEAMVSKNLNAGIYLVKITGKDISETIKVVVE